MKFLLIDASADFRNLLRSLLTKRWPDAQVLAQDPRRLGPASAALTGAECRLVFLDYDLGAHSGLDYLAHFQALPGFPPVVMLTGAGYESLAEDAIRLGAADYIPKHNLTPKVLADAVEGALDRHGAVERYRQRAADRGTPGPAAAPRFLHGYRTVRELGRGGMSRVYLIERESDGDAFALKLMDVRHLHADPAAVQRFMDEYKLLRRLADRRIVRTYEQGFSNEYAYIVMEYFEAGSLRHFLSALNGPLELRHALDYAIQIAGTLDAVHRAGVVHGDLKPENVMRRRDGSLVLIDFGTAQRAQARTGPARSDIVLGTPHYMSPEQAEGFEPDPRSDLYSLGAILFEMLAGYVPYSARTHLAVLYKQRQAPIPDVRGIPDGAQRIVRRLLAKKREDRFQTAREVVGALQSLALPAPGRS
ncbi:MAG: protein kinase [Gammaproteobacteria bacterium]|nr:protein kinase [Gammaproteobacteria bacterium]